MAFIIEARGAQTERAHFDVRQKGFYADRIVRFNDGEANAELRGDF